MKMSHKFNKATKGSIDTYDLHRVVLLNIVPAGLYPDLVIPVTSHESIL